jgi:hypothetical protein
MQGHVPVPPQPHVPTGLGPIIGYVATREPQPLEDRPAEVPPWGEEGVYEEEWGLRHRPALRVTAAILALCLVVAGMSTVLQTILAGR